MPLLHPCRPSWRRDELIERIIAFAVNVAIGAAWSLIQNRQDRTTGD
jgi:hypothetical protein